MNIPESKIIRAKELITTSKHISLATTNADGSPHNSPVRFYYDEKLERIYWSSNAEAAHSQNILRTGQVFGVLFDRIEFGGVYMKCEDGHTLAGKELEAGLAIVNASRAKEGSEKISADFYTAGSVRKLWSAHITHLWINMAVRDGNGFIIKDERVELDKRKLLAV
ncbi:MAG TPA: pyridoxamine 5'-phosphate oxidase family protein [Candidatus Paceibacterota bacterium]